MALFVSNTFFHFKYKMKRIFCVYEALSAIYMILAMVAYWNPLVIERLNLFSILPLIFIISIDIHFSIWGRLEGLGLKVPGLSRHEEETAKVISILFTSPAYIVGLLLAFELFCNGKLF